MLARLVRRRRARLSHNGMNARHDMASSYPPLRAVAWAIALIVVSVDVIVASAEDSIDLDRALAIMRALEGKIQTARWKVTAVSGSLSDPADPNSIRDVAPEKLSGLIAYEIGSGRYRAEIQATSKWIEGAAPYLSTRELFTNDGQLARVWSQSRHGEEPPDVEGDAGEGWIAKAGSNDVPGFEANLAGSGIAYFPPNFKRIGGADVGPLSSFLTQNRKAGIRVAIVEVDQAKWRIETVDGRFAVLIDYDPGRGGIITAASWCGSEKWHPDAVFVRLIVVHQQIGEFWVPKTASLCYALDKPPGVERVTFDDVRLNEPLTSSDYTVDFPVGTFVTDFVAERAYTVSGGPIDEQEAVREFMRRFGLKEQSPLSKVPERFYLIVGAIAFPTLLYIAWVVWRRRRRTGCVSLFVPLLMLLFASHSLALGQALTPSPDGSWVIFTFRE